LAGIAILIVSLSNRDWVLFETVVLFAGALCLSALLLSAMAHIAVRLISKGRAPASSTDSELPQV
jgi:hypothetical protein